MSRTHTNRRRTSPTGPSILTIGVRHDARAWATFALLAMMLVASVPFVSTASAQVPGVPPLPLPVGPTEEPTSEPTDTPTEEEGPAVPGLPAGEEPPAGGGLKTAYYTTPNSAVAPNTLISEFPPGIVCILRPEFCTEDAQELTNPIQEGVGQGAAGLDSGTASAQQPVPPGALPVGVLSGSPRYTSAFGIPLPAVGDNQSFGEFLVTLQMSDMSFAVESPAFRAFVLSVISQAGSNGGPEAFEAFFAGLASQETPLFTTDFAGLEMCVIKTPWDAGDNQPRAEQPDIDALFCSPVAKPDESGAVTFDMTFAANDSLPNGFVPGWEGVLVRPLASQNLAYGDADYTTNYYAYFENPDEFPPAISAPVVDGPPPAPPVTAPNQNTGSNPSGSGFGGGSSGGGFGGGTAGSSGSRPSSGGSSVAAAPALSAPGAPGGADVGESLAVPTDDSLMADGVAPAPLDATPVDVASSGWIPWILLPMLLGGAFWYGRVLEGGPLADVLRSGAMTRLLRERGFQI